ncbi:formylglycine-generating enzyme family protein [Candidatus Uabimicrobium sp. HlEnr_7]|uniref:formylglycine-generating enzyme family protein n=1 Tax=Candidatus Uabimicrobium helgolandensis TaxID=3095367 RepID=UPI00355756F4
MENIYHKLLGVDKNVTTPDYYEMLNISSQKFNIDILQENYKLQLQKLQRLGNNPKYKETILFLKSELRKARSHLENTESRNEYNRVLQKRKLQKISETIDLFRIKGYIDNKEWSYLQKVASQYKISQAQLKTLVGERKTPKKHNTYREIIYICLLLVTLLFYNKDFLTQQKIPTKTLEEKQPVETSFSKSSNIPSHMMYIPEGSFYMGYPEGSYDERPSRKVYLEAFYISKYEVTNADYYNFVKETNYSIPYAKKQLPSNQRFNWNPLAKKYPEGKSSDPVVLVSWENAIDYCKWLSKKIHLNVSLPTEAQWEKAARGEAELSQYPWGPFAKPNMFYANYKTSRDGFAEIAPVNSFIQGCSPFGCYNMSGNVAEWCLDSYSPTAYSTLGKTNPLYLDNNIQRKVVRGGSWANKIHKLRVSSRAYRNKKQRDIHTGFRYVILISK